MSVTTKDEIIGLIRKNMYIPNPVTESSNLYTDLRFDSLSFMVLLTEIEDACSVAFDIAEMEMCLNVGTLIQVTENKIKERAGDND